MIQMNAGTDSVKSSGSMSLIGDIMNKPTNTRIGAGCRTWDGEEKRCEKQGYSEADSSYKRSDSGTALLERCLMRSLQMCYRIGS